MEKEVKMLKFTCDEDLSKYVDSMLFDSGEEIAFGVFAYGDEKVEISLRVCGDVAVDYKGVVYHRPSEFPDELRQRIKDHPWDWDVYAPSGEGNDEPDSDIYVSLNNWFEYLFDGDGDLYEEDLSEATPEMIRDDMEYIARRYFGLGR